MIAILLKPRILSFKNRGSSKDSKWHKVLLFAIIGLLFWAGLFAVSLRVLKYFKSIQDVGDILSIKLLSMIMITFFSVLMFSSILTSLSKLYLSKDLSLVHSMPVPTYKIFVARWIEITIDSSWMVFLYMLPIFISYGIVYKGGVIFYINMFLSLSILSMITSAISGIIVMLVVFIIPATRIKNVFLFLSLCFFVVLYVAVRLLRPERLVNPEAFETVLSYLKTLKAPAPIYLPSTWAFDSLKASLFNLPVELIFNLGLLISFGGLVYFLMIIISDSIYFKGFSKSQAASKQLIAKRILTFPILNLLPRHVHAFAIKEIKIFYRDQTQWSQLFLIGVLIFIYVYNFTVIPLDKIPIKTIYLQNLLSFLNIGLAAFVLTAITARFVYPAVSIEGQAFWIVKMSPIKLKTFLWLKFFIYFFPLLVLSEVLIIVTNIYLSVTPFMMYLSSITIFFIVPGVVSMGIGMGAAYPDFKSENPAQAVTSFGGLLFMILCAAYTGIVVLLEAGPVYAIFMSGMKDRALSALELIWIVISFIIAFILSLLAIILPMQFGEKKLLLNQ
ncbi:MAG: hypothetical protein HQK78_14840 [Desulfobacterales bacterium]|nr:hypothetical protein [Desulfobacterales bacterium]